MSSSPEPDETLGITIKETQSLLNHRMDQALRPLGLTVPQYACLTALQDSPEISGSDLARRTFVSRQSTHVLLQGLERRGLVVRGAADAGSRARSVEPTAAARELLPQAHTAVRLVTASMTAALSTTDLEHLLELLGRCRDALGEGRR